MAEPVQPASWWVYVLRSTTRSRTYVGIALSVARRLAQHNGELVGGASSTRAGRPWQIAAVYGPFDDRAAASRAEYQVKARRGPARFNAPGLPCLTDASTEP